MYIDYRIDAINSLAPNAKYMTAGDGITWLDDDIAQPSESDIAAEVIRLQAIYTSKDYSRARKDEYDLLNQDEMRFDDLVNGTTTWVDAINAIKAAHPKT